LGVFWRILHEKNYLHGGGGQDLHINSSFPLPQTFSIKLKNNTSQRKFLNFENHNFLERGILHVRGFCGWRRGNFPRGRGANA
jgi:hypothetical protein